MGYSSNDWIWIKKDSILELNKLNLVCFFFFSMNFCSSIFNQQVVTGSLNYCYCSSCLLVYIYIYLLIKT